MFRTGDKVGFALFARPYLQNWRSPSFPDPSFKGSFSQYTTYRYSRPNRAHAIPRHLGSLPRHFFPAKVQNECLLTPFLGPKRHGYFPCGEIEQREKPQIPTMHDIKRPRTRLEMSELGITSCASDEWMRLGIRMHLHAASQCMPVTTGLDCLLKSESVLCLVAESWMLKIFEIRKERNGAVMDAGTSCTARRASYNTTPNFQ
ncbi:hypothetical protein FB567DRAFT_188473 [Paraphoma chrysanthemicola]|uniref:Uncharacterized protein n=1 Tax=Paraphoma chrysanthemicola TaxID=798071 RepID=A0A8K0VT08_9PLEO|nr:hypothetical protein FB567DRAFT_188473 [Paraphoma chrysanthemicola]